MKKIAIFSFLIVVTLFTINHYYSTRYNLSFNSNTWKNWNESESTMSTRWDMIKSLKRKHQLIGLNENEIIELLGEPDSKSDFEFKYGLGAARSGVDYGILLLRLEDGIVQKVKVYKH